MLAEDVCEMSRSETEVLITHSTTSTINFMFLSILLAIQVPEVNIVAQVDAANTVGYNVCVSSLLQGDLSLNLEPTWIIGMVSPQEILITSVKSLFPNKVTFTRSEY